MSKCLYCGVEGLAICHPCQDYLKSNNKDWEMSLKCLDNLLAKMKKDCDELEEAIKMLKE